MGRYINYEKFYMFFKIFKNNADYSGEIIYFANCANASFVHILYILV